ncbi:hypothetical protein BF14_014895 [Streptomyces griseus]|nr:hypothetical protein DIJ69_14890 [Streptomyces globisporus]PPA40924.1 hypothetical protein BF14_014895 [Streptomyces griseus]RAN18265.1 hypothetical protein A3838_14580 [Streptomyces badius]RAN26147.1 hypothetical protein A3800_14590 [Streptomyces badius]
MVGEQEFGYRRLLMCVGHRPGLVLGARHSLASGGGSAEQQIADRLSTFVGRFFGPEAFRAGQSVAQVRRPGMPDCGAVPGRALPSS